MHTYITSIKNVGDDRKDDNSCPYGVTYKHTIPLRYIIQENDIYKVTLESNSEEEINIERGKRRSGIFPRNSFIVGYPEIRLYENELPHILFDRIDKNRSEIVKQFQTSKLPGFF